MQPGCINSANALTKSCPALFLRSCGQIRPIPGKSEGRLFPPHPSPATLSTSMLRAAAAVRSGGAQRATSAAACQADRAGR